MRERLLRVNLTDRSFREEEIPPKVLESYIGGKGLAAHYAYQEIEPGTEPLSAENKIMVFIGPLTAIYHVYSRHVIASKSPLTNTFSDSYAGGWFGAELAKTGYAGIIIEGRADSLVYLKVDGARVSIEDAGHLAGKNPYEVDALFKGYHVAAIGPAGERLVRFACVINDADKNQRAGVSGRGGLGAVMGFKKLKAIVVKGESDAGKLVPEGARDGVAKHRKDMLGYLKKDAIPMMGLGGNLPVTQLCVDAKVLPVGNFKEGYIDGHERVSEDAFRQVTIGKTTCFRCPVACGVHIKVKEGRFAGLDLDRVEYETVALNGPNCRQLDIGTIAKVGRLCNEYGMDTISVGNITAFIMECSEKGLIDYKLDWGDAGGQVELAEMMGQRVGLGDTLAEGLMRVADKLGLQDHALHIKGLEIPGYDVRGPVGMALAYATADRGGDHLRAWTIGSELEEQFSTKGKAKLTKDIQDRNSATWCLIACDNIPANASSGYGVFMDHSIKALNTLGWKMDEGKFMEVGERIYNLTRQFNVREGFSRKDDALPLRFHEPRTDTGWKLTKADFDTMLDEYYSIRGWDNDGKPTPETLNRLGIQA